MVKVRLSRGGSKKRPFYHIVVADKSRARNGKFIEQIGYYDPSRPITEAHVDHERYAYWKGVGAQTSKRVQRVIFEHSKAVSPAS